MHEIFHYWMRSVNFLSVVLFTDFYKKFLYKLFKNQTNKLYYLTDYICFRHNVANMKIEFNY